MGSGLAIYWRYKSQVRHCPHSIVLFICEMEFIIIG